MAGPLLEDLLCFACQELQLTTTLHDEAEKHYDAVSRWLADRGSCFYDYDADIYAQGSFRIGTTTRPILQSEYDLDFVMQLSANAPDDPMLLLELLEARLKDNGRYRDKVKRLKRCVRLVYAGDFHMDILPAVSASGTGTGILVPDRELRGWKPSNPLGFAAWFEQRSRTVRLDKVAAIEPLPAIQSVEEKTTLQRVVQLLKRARDRFAADPELSPRSIVLTTLAGEGYAGAPSTAGTMSEVLQYLSDRVAASSGPIVVRNPANPDELLSEQWDKNRFAYEQFKLWLIWFSGEWSKVMSAPGLADLNKLLSSLFGEEIAVGAVKKHAARMDELRKAEKLRVTAKGAIVTTGGAATIPRNTFYGDD